MTILYRAYNDKDELLYIGIAENWGRRWSQHSERSAWYSDVAHVKVEQHPTRQAAMEAERDAIHLEQPIHNIEHTARDTRPSRWGTSGSLMPVRSYNHDRLAPLDTYQAAVQAISNLANDPKTHPVITSQEALAATVADIARFVPYADGCPQCPGLEPAWPPSAPSAGGPAHPVEHGGPAVWRIGDGHLQRRPVRAVDRGPRVRLGFGRQGQELRRAPSAPSCLLDR